MSFLFGLATGILYNSLTRKYLIRFIEKTIASNLKPGKNNAFSSPSPRIQFEKKMMAFTIIQSIKRSVEKGIINKDIAQATLKLWGKALMAPRQKNKEVDKFYLENGSKPPFLLVISPGHSCNLKCRDCYAGSGLDGTKLSWDILDKIISDARRLWNIKLVVFSGGEPFAYNSQGKDILDIAAKEQDCLFLAFTNGTLINPELAGRIAACKNITPAFSVEGMRPATDSRRGAGTLIKCLQQLI